MAVFLSRLLCGPTNSLHGTLFAPWDIRFLDALDPATVPPPTGRRSLIPPRAYAPIRGIQTEVIRFLLAELLLTCIASAQLVSRGAPIPKRTKPPVIFVNGYQADCSGSSFSATFGLADQVLAANGESSVFFDNCTVPGKPAIEDLGLAFGKFLAALKYDDGSAVSTVDVIAHSMGGLIVRSYLAGKDASGAVYTPPVAFLIRKVVFLSTPHFGTGLATLLGVGSTDKQVTELNSGSRFLFDLGTWNQGTDDLRGVDAISVAGNGGTGSPLGTGVPRFDDGVVALTSSSLRFYLAGRTRILTLCHTGPGLVTLGGLCPPGERGIADIQTANDDNARIVLSFLNGTADWRSIGTAAENNEYLSSNAGLALAVRSADDQSVTIDSVTVSSRGTSKKLNISAARDVAYTDLIPSGAVDTVVSASSVIPPKSLGVEAGGYMPFTMKPGPYVYRVLPSASRVFPLVVAPGEIVSVYGDLLDQGQVLIGGQPLRQFYNSPSQINALMPDGVSGLTKLTVKTTTGSHTVNIMVEAAMPSIYTQNTSGEGAASALNAVTAALVTAAAPLHAGDYLSLYLTGLGATQDRGGLSYSVLQPTVTVGGKPCLVSYAGRAPLYPGLDQINCQIPSGISAGAAEVVVTSGLRSSNRPTVAIQ